MENLQVTGNTNGVQYRQSTTWTVVDILRNYVEGRFGIPHFQRGLVWDDAMLGALLDSLYFDTPCGAIVLWKPVAQNLRDHGLPIGPYAAHEKVRYLLVDGQQRIRSLGKVSGLLEALQDHGGSGAPVIAYGDEQRDESTGELRVWCVNLARTPQFQECISQVRELPLFLLRADPGHRRLDHSTRRDTPYNVVPVRKLAMFENLVSWDQPQTYLHQSLLVEEAAGKTENRLREVRKALQEIPKRTFFVRILEDASFPDVVRIYNRINSAGKRVEAEERALAIVSALDPETDQRLQQMFVAVHGRDADRDDALRQHDELLKRQRERTLGFKFLMRAFVQACAQHSQLSADAAALSFDAVDRDSFRKNFAGATAAHRATVWDSAKRAVTCVARVLPASRLGSAFTRPEASTLTPLPTDSRRFSTRLHSTHMPLRLDLVRRRSSRRVHQRRPPAASPFSVVR